MVAILGAALAVRILISGELGEEKSHQKNVPDFVTTTSVLLFTDVATLLPATH